MSKFVHLHAHSEYSTLDGASKISALVDKAIANGMPAVAITDHGNMFGTKEFFNYVCKKNAKYDDAIKNIKKQLNELKNEDEDEERKEKIQQLQNERIETEKKKFKPIIGCEVYVAANTRHEKKGKENASGYHLVLLAKNKIGYHNLVKMVSLGYIEGFYYKPRIDRELMEKYHEGIIASSACLGGEIPQHLMHNEPEKAEEAVLWHKNLFGDDYYIELQRHKSDDPNSARDVYEHQKVVNVQLMELAKKHNIKLIATNDSHFTNEEEAEAHDRLLCISTGTDVNDPNRMRYTKQEWFKTPAEMEGIFADIPEALANTLEIADKVEFYDINSVPIMPDFPLPEGFADADDYLKHLTYEGAKKHYSEITDEVKERIDFELGTIRRMGYPGYFLIVQDFIAWARNNGVAVGPGRGSAAGSVVAYCLGITDIDPLKYDLLFERFLNPDRISMPDIDIDFDDDGRARVLEYVENKYGKEKVAHIVTFGTMAAKSAIKDVGRVQKLPLAETDRLSKLIDELPRDVKVSIKNAIENISAMREAAESTDPLMSDTLKYAQMLEGTVRNTGVHACGVVIGKDDLYNYIPISTTYDKETKQDMLVSQYEGTVIEEVGMLKMDFLGLKTLSIIKDALDNIRRSKGTEIDINTIPIDDTKTYELYSSGQTVGTFQFESPGMQKYLRELKPTQFEDLIAMNALYRPGPMDYILDFVDRKHGRKPITYDIPIMERYLKDTYGITVYQEQVMLLSRLLANFSRGQSDELRKAMGKKLKDKMDALKVKFVEGCKANGHDEKTVLKIWEDWEKFASYAFNKSHAACYSWVAYQTAYLKANYPAEYMAAVLTRNSSDIKEISKFMDECKRMGIQVLSPDVNESYRTFTVNKDGNIRFGLSAIKGMGINAVENIIQERDANGPFKDIFDFICRVNLSAVNRKTIETLAFSGGFDSFSEIKRHQFTATNKDGQTFVEALLSYGNKKQNDTVGSQSLFGEALAESIVTPEIPRAEEWSILEILSKEKELIGMYLSSHPLDPYAFEIKQFCNVSLYDLKDLESLKGKTICFAGMVSDVSHQTSKAGKPFGSVTIEDYSDSYRFMLFSKDWVDNTKFFVKGYFLYIKAKVQPRYGKDELEAKILSIHLLPNIREELVQNITIKLPIEAISLELIGNIKRSAERNPGSIGLRLKILDGEVRIALDLFSRNYRINLSNDILSFFESYNIDYSIN
ncbi:MAG: DNA polymerase III subunit alpha [Prevotellaceae bacterium]|jgi:DNA polymerase-3 subunit alpha|nr:DNA polymerase III subunit alpha [Prevotellaceae bacterium]